ncbi:MAG: hypothetical protein JXA90_14580 [Planctomycetes bacterium]|nr:hypothetical protein [Planctomycetota bacterium]
MRSTGLALAATLSLLTLITPCSADSVSFQLVEEFSGAQQPEGYIIATFDDGGAPGSVTLTIDATNLVGTEFVKEMYFNLDPSLDPSALRFEMVGGSGQYAEPSYPTGSEAFRAGGAGYYDVVLGFREGPPQQRLGAGDVIQIEITGIECLTAGSFNFLSAPGGSLSPFPVAAHVGGVGPDGEGSGWVTVVPEPGSFLLAVVSMGGAGFFLGWRRRRRRA